MQIESQELEWYYPLLQPWVHYIPLRANETWVNLEEAIGWAEAHPAEVPTYASTAQLLQHAVLEISCKGFRVRDSEESGGGHRLGGGAPRRGALMPAQRSLYTNMHF